MSISINFHNINMSEAQKLEFKNGILYFYTHASKWEKPMEDGLVIVSENEYFIGAFVFDGMGGHARADEAVKLAYQSIKKVFSSKNVSSNHRHNFFDAIELADQKVKELKVDAGSTVVAMEVGKDFARCYHAGDSIGLIIGSRGKEKYATREHSPKGAAQEIGILQEKQVEQLIDDFVVSNGLGFNPMRVEVSQRVEISNGDLLFISSDNIPKNFTEEEVLNFISTGEFDKRVLNLLDAMKAKQEEIDKDDTSFLLFKYNTNQ